MDGILSAVVIAAVGGFASFIFGQLLPRSIFNPGKFPFRTLKWENGGKIYMKLKVHVWKDSVPDMSRIIPGMVKKKAQLARTPETMYRLVQETCVAEFIHWLLVIAISPAIYAALCGLWGILAAIAYAAGNLSFIIIQRYNRPRLVELHKRMEKRREKCS